jgi:hypothetical protein
MTDTYLPQGSQSVTCQSACNEGLYKNGQLQGSNWTTCFSSHEVPNFWPWVDTSTNPPTETWFAAHLMYWVGQGLGIDTGTIGNGCLVLSMANSPTSLGWSLGSGPNTCAGTFPPGNQALLFGTLTNLVQPVSPGTVCNSWGEPAVTVAAAPSGSGYALYLATSCLDYTSVSQGYYIFASQSFPSTPPQNTVWSWSYYSGPFKYSDIDLSSIDQSNGGINSLTEFDWAARADGTMVAVITPMYVGAPLFQYGCLAFDFYLTNTTSPFGSLVATLSDTDTGNPTATELYGTNGCTYEPMGNTGVILVRRLVDNTTPYTTDPYLSPSANETFTLLDTGYLP